MTPPEKLFRPARSLPSPPLVVLMARALCLGFLRGAQGVFFNSLPSRNKCPIASRAGRAAAPAVQLPLLRQRPPLHGKWWGEGELFFSPLIIVSTLPVPTALATPAGSAREQRQR